MVLKEEIIQLIVEIRKNKKISQERLGRGICSEQQISKLEKGELPSDYFLLEMLLQRLGKTFEKLEIVLSKEEFSEIRERDDIIDALRFGDRELAEKYIQHFCGDMVSLTPMHRMNAYKVQGLFAYETGDYATAEKQLRHAIEMSMDKELLDNIIVGYGSSMGKGSPAGESFQMKLFTSLFSNVELESLILLAEIFEKQGQNKEAARLLTFTYEYVRREITDEEQLVKFLPKLAFVAGTLAQKVKRMAECIPLCEEALTVLRRQGMVQLMTLLLEYLAVFYQDGGEEKKSRKYFIWKDTIEQVFLFFGLNVDIVNKLYFNSCTGQYYLIGEILREERIAQGISQIELIEGIYTNPETLSRVENGSKPDSKKLALLYEKLGIQKRRYNGRVITKDYDLLELHSEVALLLARKEQDRAMWELEKLRKRLDMSIPENRQMVECFETMYQYKAGELSAENAIQKMQELLKLTYHKNCKRIPFEAEGLLINQICRLLVRLKRFDEAIELQKKIIIIHERSDVPLKYHYRIVYLLMENMSHYMVHVGYLEECENWSERAAVDQLKNGKGDSIYVALSNAIGIGMNKEEERQYCEKWTKWAYYLADIFMCYHDQKCFEDFEKKYFDENVEWY